MNRRFAIVRAGIFVLVAASVLSTAYASAPPLRRIEIDAARFAFDPGVITLKKGEPVILVLKSEDVAHGLRCRELGIDMKVHGHGSSEIRITPDKTGDFIGHCSVFCGAEHGHMTLTLHVVS